MLCSKAKCRLETIHELRTPSKYVWIGLTCESVSEVRVINSLQSDVEHFILSEGKGRLQTVLTKAQLSQKARGRNSELDGKKDQNSEMCPDCLLPALPTAPPSTEDARSAPYCAVCIVTTVWGLPLRGGQQLSVPSSQLLYRDQHQWEGTPFA